MSSSDSSNAVVSQRYETIFSVFMLMVVFLYRHNEHLVFPQIFYLFAAMLMVNLIAGWVLRKWPSSMLGAVAIVLANCGVITAILAQSGGPLSNLWVLYLLPIYTVCLLLNGLQLALIVSGIISFNAVFYCLWNEPCEEGSGFDIALRTGIFIFAAGVTWKFAQKDRQTKEKLALQRSDIKRVESELLAEHGRLQDARTMADIGQLASGIAHDLIGPLTVITGTARMMLEDAATKAYHADLERIVRAVTLCETISQNVLGFARSHEMKLEPCDLTMIIDAALQVYEPLLIQSGITVDKKLNLGLPRVNCSLGHIERIFLNLLSNARAAMPNGGRLTISGKTVFPGTGDMPWAQITLEDNGPGIPADVMERIFKPFNTSKAVGKGTGLGLYLSRQIAMDHGGRLLAQNRPEGGARFTLSLPAAMTGAPPVSKAA